MAPQCSLFHVVQMSLHGHAHSLWQMRAGRKRTMPHLSWPFTTALVLPPVVKYAARVLCEARASLLELPWLMFAPLHGGARCTDILNSQPVACNLPSATLLQLAAAVHSSCWLLLAWQCPADVPGGVCHSVVARKDVHISPVHEWSTLV